MRCGVECVGITVDDLPGAVPGTGVYGQIAGRVSAAIRLQVPTERLAQAERPGCDAIRREAPSGNPTPKKTITTRMPCSPKMAPSQPLALGTMDGWGASERRDKTPDRETLVFCLLVFKKIANEEDLPPA
jgi:hypothetical protein